MHTIKYTKFFFFSCTSFAYIHPSCLSRLLLTNNTSVQIRYNIFVKGFVFVCFQICDDIEKFHCVNIMAIDYKTQIIYFRHLPFIFTSHRLIRRTLMQVTLSFFFVAGLGDCLHFLLKTRDFYLFISNSIPFTLCSCFLFFCTSVLRQKHFSALLIRTYSYIFSTYPFVYVITEFVKYLLCSYNLDGTQCKNKNDEYLTKKKKKLAAFLKIGIVVNETEKKICEEHLLRKKEK